MNMIRRKILLIVGFWFILSSLQAQLPRLILNEVFVDFAVGVDNPLIKSKFNVYDPVGPTMEQFDENISKIKELNIETYRIELGWGRRYSGFGLNRMIDGTPENLTYNFKPLDHMVTELKKQNVLLHGAYCYCPFPLQDTTIARYRDSRAPNSIENWKEIVTNVARHYYDMGIAFGVDEVWNEADGLYVFYSGTKEEFEELYKATVEGILSVNPDATIAGPALAPELVWYKSFPEFIARENLPMDAFTFHHYGSAELGLHSIDKVMNSLLGLRVDYEMNGNYTKSVLFHGPYRGLDLYDVKRDVVFPWGTLKEADKDLMVDNLSDFTIRLKENAPKGWIGKVHIAFIMQNTGTETRAKFIIRSHYCPNKYL